MKTAAKIKNIRMGMGLTQAEFAQFLGLSGAGERTVRGWESGEHMPTESRLEEIRKLQIKAPFKTKSTKNKFKFIDLFAGIGGIRLPFQELGGECVFSSEWDKFSQKTYATNFGHLPHGDITKIAAQDIPAHDILLETKRFLDSCRLPCILSILAAAME